ncbi:lipid A deacylase LpxR family protein [Tenacibaculum sp. C7A-26P2]|uniref:lipid A deacylase LpxR family protein n=1 Tax=Tenacibaculum sp. C7A-26P2 TaxID=3447504 RepID=UPI003F8800F7
MKNFKAFLFIIIPFYCYSQKQYSKEFSFINDNDLYISYYQDRYYTNGIFLTYRFIDTNNKSKAVKKIYNIQLGHKMYTPFKAVVQSPELHDRPFAGYLYGGFGIDQFYEDDSFIKNSIEIGAIGPISIAKELQNFIHDIYGFKRAVGWQYQIKDAFAFNFKTTFGTKLFETNSKYFDLNWLSEASLGTVLGNVNTGLLGRFSLIQLQEVTNSIAFGSNLNASGSNSFNEKEFFLFIKPKIEYIFYDATIQGSFLNNDSPITYPVMPFVFTNQIGICFTSGKFHFGYTVNYHSKKLKSTQVPRGNFFGTIQINYQFK